ncbi:hypothetical protein B0H12DRAFT_1021412 [Mycena haematopus]|nr:hypothetical protein B0H12DRAFT_1021412 [Mycena haematopus]
MKYSATLVALSLVAFRAEAHRLPSRYAGQRRGDQFVTGPCTQDSDCQQGCCGFSTGKCAGPAVAQSNGSGGCGFGTAAPNCNVATALGLGSQCIAGAKNGNIADPGVQAAAAFAAKLDNIPFTPAAAPAAAAPAAAAPAAAAPPSSAAPPSIASLAAQQTSKLTVFEACSADSACQQGCCGFASGKCAGPDVAQTNGSGGCGHGNAAPNCDVATLLGFKSSCISGAVQGNLQDNAVQAAAAFAAQLDNLPFTPSAAAAPAAAAPAAAAPAAAAPPSSAAPPSIASLAAKQTSKLTVFEACSADSACQQGCCGFSSGKCAGPAVAQTNGSGGCGHGNAAPNCDVATLLGFKSQCIGGTVQGNLQDPTVQAAAAFAAQLDNIAFTPSK